MSCALWKKGTLIKVLDRSQPPWSSLFLSHSPLECYRGGVVVASVSSRCWYWECFSYPRGVLGAGDNVWLSVAVPHSLHRGAADADKCAQRLKSTFIPLTLGTPGLFSLSSVRPPPCTWFHHFCWWTQEIQAPPAHSRVEAKLCANGTEQWRESTFAKLLASLASLSRCKRMEWERWLWRPHLSRCSISHLKKKMLQPVTPLSVFTHPVGCFRVVLAWWICGQSC